MNSEDAQIPHTIYAILQVKFSRHLCEKTIVVQGIVIGKGAPTITLQLLLNSSRGK